MSKTDWLLFVASAVFLTALMAVLVIDFVMNGGQTDYLRMIPWNW